MHFPTLKKTPAWNRDWKKSRNLKTFCENLLTSQNNLLGTPKAANFHSQGSLYIFAQRGYESSYKKRDSNYNKLKKETSVTISVSQKLIHMNDL